MEIYVHLCIIKQNITKNLTMDMLEGFPTKDIDKEKMPMNVLYSDDDIVIIDGVRKLVDYNMLRMKMNGILLCMEGSAQVDVNGNQTVLHKGQLVMFPSNTRFDNMLFSYDFQSKALLISDQIIGLFIRPYLQTWNEMMYINGIRPIDMSESNMHFISLTYDIVNFCLQGEKSQLRNEIIKRYVQGGLLGLMDLISKNQVVNKLPKRVKGSEVFPKFLQLLQKERANFKSVADYADRLCINRNILQ